jgi:XTP/dITP diphosphohydrolase
VLEGHIAEERRGTEGFGYDPIFVPEGEERTVAELGDEWKSRNSHRARAARALLAAIRERTA